MIRARSRRPMAVVALAVAVVVTVTGVSGCTSPPSASASAKPVAATEPASPPPATPSASPATPSASPATKAPQTPAPKPSTPAKLTFGDKGVAVLRLQQRLTALGYWLGKPDGHFGTATQQAVFALQKAAGLRPTGTVGAKTRKALDAGTVPAAKSKSSRVIEVNLKRDLLLFVTNGHVNFVLNTSTGGGYTYHEQGQTNVAITPKGHFRTYRVIDGQHRSPLGLMFRPRYFTGGFAIHGDSYVPARPVSHGCVRVTDAAINWIWATNQDPIGTPVWVY